MDNVFLLKEEAVRLRSEGMPCIDIAKKLGVSNSTITRWTRSVGKKAHTLEVRKRVVELMDNGFTAKEVAMKMGMQSVSAIYHIYKRYKDTNFMTPLESVQQGWVLNHPYQFELQPAERKRYREVVANRKRLCPNGGCEYIRQS